MTKVYGTRAATTAGGAALIAAALGFVAVFAWLAAEFNYPDVLDGEAVDVLPALLGLGATGRAVWAVYAFLPLLLIPAAVGAYAAFSGRSPGMMRGAFAAALLAAFSMSLGLARWPSIQWELARSYSVATPEMREVLDGVFAGLNSYLGNYIGEFAGEVGLNAFFILTALAALRNERIGQWFGFGGVVVGVAGLIGAFRNVTDIVAPIAGINNYLLPVWLVVMGVVLIRWEESGGDGVEVGGATEDRELTAARINE